MTALTDAPTPTEADVAEFRQLHQRLGDAIEAAVHGKRSTVDLVLVSVFAEGHVLLEDVPGTGKTTLARAVAQALGGQMRRVQFTPDLLPSDVTGTTVFDPRDGEIRFRPGPVFGHVLLADEINRAAAKTQSSLLEVMQERTVTVGGETHPVPDPFVVIATQNPVDLDGTYRLPEAQLDRFLVRVTLGFPDAEHEVEVLRPGSTAGQVSEVARVTTPDEVAMTIRRLETLHVADLLLRYVRDIGVCIREDPRIRLGRQHPRAAGAGPLPAGVRRGAGPQLRRAGRRPAPRRTRPGPPHGAHPRRRTGRAHALLGGARRPGVGAAAAA